MATAGQLGTAVSEWALTVEEAMPLVTHTSVAQTPVASPRRRASSLGQRPEGQEGQPAGERGRGRGAAARIPGWGALLGRVTDGSRAYPGSGERFAGGLGRRRCNGPRRGGLGGSGGAVLRLLAGEGQLHSLTLGDDARLAGPPR